MCTISWLCLLHLQEPARQLTAYLQQDIRTLLVEYSEKQLPPILEEEAFRKAFRKNFEDEEEMTEAVYCLNLQGT